MYENKLDEMQQIMEILHRYVPTLSPKCRDLLPNGESLKYDNTKLLEIILEETSCLWLKQQELKHCAWVIRQHRKDH